MTDPEDLRNEIIHLTDPNSSHPSSMPPSKLPLYRPVTSRGFWSFIHKCSSAATSSHSLQKSQQFDSLEFQTNSTLLLSSHQDEGFKTHQDESAQAWMFLLELCEGAGSMHSCLTPKYALVLDIALLTVSIVASLEDSSHALPASHVES